MSDNVQLPALGDSVTEGTVPRWLKNVGDTVEVDEPLLEISTDKVDTEIPSPFAGVLEQILVQEDETVDVGAPLAVIGSGQGASDGSAGGASDGAAAEQPAEEAAQPQHTQEQQPAQAEESFTDAVGPSQSSAMQSQETPPQEPDVPEQPAAQEQAPAQQGSDGQASGGGASDGQQVTMPALG